MDLDHVRSEIEHMRVQVVRHRKEILQLERAGISTVAAEALLQRMLDKIDRLCEERDKLKKEQPAKRIGALGGRKCVGGQFLFAICCAGVIQPQISRAAEDSMKRCDFALEFCLVKGLVCCANKSLWSRHAHGCFSDAYAGRDMFERRCVCVCARQRF